MILKRQQNTPKWVVHELREDQLDRALPLIQIAGQDTTVDDWRKDLLESGPCGGEAGSGVASIEDGGGYIFGLFCYRIRDVADRNIVTVGRVIVPDTVVPTLSHRLIDILDGFVRDVGGVEIEILPEAAPPDSLLGKILEGEFDYCPAHWTRTLPGID